MKWSLFTIKIERAWCATLDNGIYFGQTLDGKMDGFGILYCYDEKDCPWLYQCEWRQDIPVFGRFVGIVDHEWWKYEGQLGAKYLPYGEGLWWRESGSKYKGGFIHGGTVGLGKYSYPNGTSLDVYWDTVTHKPEGIGKLKLNYDSLFRNVHI